VVDVRRVRPALAELSLAFTGFLVGIFAILVAGALGLLPRGEAAGLVSGPALTAIAAAVYATLARRLPARAEIGEAVHVRPRATVGKSVLVAGVGLVAALVGSFLLGKLLELIGIPVEEQGDILRIVEHARETSELRALILLGVAATVLAPLVEEWFFRGLLFRRLREIVGRGIALATSAVVFAAIHANPAGSAIYAWLGVVFALALDRSGRLWVPIAVHMGNNAVAFALLVLGEDAI
jgi:membrane protease YdiL (CAAX protease family)